jgi:hypothetical protein
LGIPRRAGRVFRTPLQAPFGPLYLIAASVAKGSVPRVGGVFRFPGLLLRLLYMPLYLIVASVATGSGEVDGAKPFAGYWGRRQRPPAVRSPNQVSMMAPVGWANPGTGHCVADQARTADLLIRSIASPET